MIPASTTITATGSDETLSGSESPRCFHCRLPVPRLASRHDGKLFCCQGCLAVYELLSTHGLTGFYQLGDAAGVRVPDTTRAADFAFLDKPPVRERIVDFADERLARVTFRAPAIHCVACVWLLENLGRLKSGIGRSEVNFPRREVSIAFDPRVVRLSEVAALLSSLGYAPELNAADLERRRPDPARRRLWLQLGIAGFASGNIMLFSIPVYLGLDRFSGPAFQTLFGWLSLCLALPVVTFSAADYWRSAWTSARRRLLTIEVPIALGIAALFAQSAVAVIAGRGEVYWDSLAGLIFFLLCGKGFQQLAYDRLVFDRDYRSFFPLSVTRRNGQVEEKVALSEVSVGDHLVIRNGELIAADGRLMAGPALIDYSFVTGEAEPVAKVVGDYLYAGGRQIGGSIQVETVKPVSQGYLASLWDREVFRKQRAGTFDTLTNRYSRRFTRAVIAVAVGAALFWGLRDPDRSVRAFTAVLIVACPCALALAAPFALGTAQRVLGRHEVFLRNPQVLETLARVDTVVFDKTGTLTTAGAGAVEFDGLPLTEPEREWIWALTGESTHPHASRIHRALALPTAQAAIEASHEPRSLDREGPRVAVHQFVDGSMPSLPVQGRWVRPASKVAGFREWPGRGIEGRVDGHEVWMGSAAWLASRSVPVGIGRGDRRGAGAGSVAHVAIDGAWRGVFVLTNRLRPEVEELVGGLARDHRLALLSGDHDAQRGDLSRVFGPAAPLRFRQSPVDKLDFVRGLQAEGGTVMMVGDGLNDAGALKQSDVGVAVVESVQGFSPASELIVTARRLARLVEVLRFSRRVVRVVRWSLGISALYNVAGVSIAAGGRLSPVICALLMPLSSVSVVAFAAGVTSWLGTRAGLGPIGTRPVSVTEVGR